LVWINIVFLGLLLISVLWAGELDNTDGMLRTNLGVIIILGGLYLSLLGGNCINKYMTTGLGSLYVGIWFILTLYVTLIMA